MMDFEKQLFRINQPSSLPSRGSMLIAEPFLREGWFNHAVIMLMQYEEQGSAMGLVLNHPTQHTLGEVVQGIDDDNKLPIYIGGPVGANRLFYLHDLGERFDGARPLGPEGLWIGGDFDQVKEYMRQQGEEAMGHLRFISGYSGWEKMQLQQELDEHVWAVVAADKVPGASYILGERGSDMWHNMVLRLGPQHRNWLYHPAFPQLN